MNLFKERIYSKLQIAVRWHHGYLIPFALAYIPIISDLGLFEEGVVREGGGARGQIFQFSVGYWRAS